MSIVLSGMLTMQAAQPYAPPPQPAYAQQPSAPRPAYAQPQPSAPQPAYAQPQPSAPQPAYAQPQPNAPQPNAPQPAYAQPQPYGTQPYAPPQPYGTQPYAPAYAPPQPYLRPYGPPAYAQPEALDDRIEWLDERHGSRYPGSKGTGMRLGGGLAVGFGALLGFSALVCMVVSAAAFDASDGQDEDAGVLAWVAVGTGVSAVAGIGAGVPLMIVGKRRQRAYHDWLLRQPIARARLQLGGGGLVLRF